jgi:HAD superfamily hydrolase (TIGR01509 family)
LSLRAVIFDCDGVLVDTEPLHYQAFQEVLGPLGLGFDYDHYLKAYIGFDDRDAFLEAFREAGRSLDPAALAGLIQEKELALKRIASKGISSFPGVVELVRELVLHKIPLAVASGALRHEVEAFTEALELRDAFPVIVAANDVNRSKPDPETYLKALQRLKENPSLSDLDPVSCIAIEDTPAGIESAKAAGLYVIGVANSYPGSLLLGLANHVVESLVKLDVAKLVGLVEQSSR